MEIERRYFERVLKGGHLNINNTMEPLILEYVKQYRPEIRNELRLLEDDFLLKYTMSSGRFDSDSSGRIDISFISHDSKGIPYGSSLNDHIEYAKTNIELLTKLKKSFDKILIGAVIFRGTKNISGTIQYTI